MKKRYNLIGLLALALTAGITTSCSDFLTQENKKALTEEQIYSDVEFIELNLKGIYNTWRDNTRQDERAWFLMTGTDEIQRGALQNKGGGEGAAMDRYDANMNIHISIVTVHCRAFTASFILKGSTLDFVGTGHQEPGPFILAGVITPGIVYTFQIQFDKLDIRIDLLFCQCFLVLLCQEIGTRCGDPGCKRQSQ